jgi:DNA-binding winged helix-turn-helix (wHTH) protein/TolB-like protein/Flp pilus assembly protein TadD
MSSEFHVGDWLVQPDQCRLSSAGRIVQVRAKVMDLLTYLAAHPGEVVSKERLLDDLWGSRMVSESALTRTVTELRQALGDNAEAPHLLETIPKRGYRLIGSVVPVTPRLEPAVAAPRLRPHRRLGAFVAGGVLLVVVVALVWLRGNTPMTPVRLAVLPFDHIGVEPDREYLADGLAEDTTVSLGMIDPARLAVIGRTSTLRYKITTKSLKEIGGELGADYLVESAVRTEGTRIRLTSKLIRVTDEALVWSHSYERELTSVLGLQLEVSAAIAEQVRVGISRETRASLERRHSRNADAYDLYLRGRTLWNARKPATTMRALEHYKRAIALDNDYALAWSGIADAISSGPVNGDADPKVAQRLAREAANEAVRADAGLAEVQTSQGLLNVWLEWNWPLAEQMLRQAIVLNPGYALAHLALANVLSHTGRHSEAAQEMTRARQADPLDPMMHAISSQLAFHAGQYSIAEAHARQALLLESEFWIAHMQLGQTLAQMGQTDLALQSLVDAERLSGGNSKPLSTRGYVLAKAGRASEARVVLEELMKRGDEGYVPRYAEALVYAGLGDRESAYDALDAAYAAHDVHLAFLTVDPKWNDYRSEPRFIRLLERCAFMSPR